MNQLPPWRLPDQRAEDLAASAPVEVTRGERSGVWIHVAPWGRRAAAAMIDGLPAVALLVAAAVHLRLTMVDRVVGTTTEVYIRPDGGFSERVVDVSATVPTDLAWGLLALAAVAALVLWFLNEGVLQAGSGQSLGKRLLRVRLVRTSTGLPTTDVWTTLRWSAVHGAWVFGIGWWTSSDVAVLGGTAVVLADGAGAQASR